MNVILARTKQEPYFNFDSPILVLGQNPPKAFVTKGTTEKYPFNFRPEYSLMEVIQHQTGTPQYNGSVMWHILGHTGEFPSLGNLVTCVTDTNTIDWTLLQKYGIGTIYHEETMKLMSKLKIIFAYGNATYHLTKKILHRYPEPPCLIKLKHPSYLIRFHRKDHEMHAKELSLITEAIYDIIGLKELKDEQS